MLRHFLLIFIAFATSEVTIAYDFTKSLVEAESEISLKSDIHDSASADDMLASDSIIGTWKIISPEFGSVALDECQFQEGGRYICYDYPEKDSRSELTIPIKGFFVVTKSSLKLFLDRDEVLDLDERLRSEMALINLDRNELILRLENASLKFHRK